VAGLLGDPGAGGIGSDRDEVRAPAVVLEVGTYLGVTGIARQASLPRSQLLPMS